MVSEITVKMHVGNVFAKLGARDRVRAVIMSYEFGLEGGEPPNGAQGAAAASRAYWSERRVTPQELTMPAMPLPDDALAMLARPNPAVMATLRNDGSPVTAATWYLWDDGRVLLNLDATRVRLQHLRRDPRVSLTVLAGDDWYSHLTLLGSVVDLQPDTDRSGIDRLSQHYTGHAYPDRVGERWSCWLEIERWTGWGALKS